MRETPLLSKSQTNGSKHETPVDIPSGPPPCVDRTVVSPALVDGVAMLMKERPHVGLLILSQVLVLNENQEGAISGEIQGTQYLVVIPLRVYVQKVNLLDVIPCEDFRHGADLDFRLK